MKFASRALLFLFITALVSACGGGSTSTPVCSSAGPSTPGGPSGSGGASANAITVSVNGTGGQCGNYGNQYNNEPCVSVKLCQGDTCQTIDDILLDTGSNGLRLFASEVTVPLTPIGCTDSGVLAECLSYGDGSSQWGQVEYASVQLGNEPAITMPIHLVNYRYSSPPGPCTSEQSYPDTDASEAGFKGILGVGLMQQDCGADCVTGTDVLQYYSCTGSGCRQAKVDLNSQVSNPVSLLPSDNNGVILSLNSVGTTGAASDTGTMYLGIGTESNNAVTGTPVTFGAAFNKNLGAIAFSTQFSAAGSQASMSFIDSGSNLFYIPPPIGGSAVSDCGTSHGASYNSYFCPSPSANFSAVNYGASGSPSGTVNFTVYNAYTLLNNGNWVFNDIGASTGTGGIFDWGLPFFLGRVVYVGIDTRTSSLGTGPYWAY